MENKMKLPNDVKEELLTLYSDLRDARENYNEAVKAVAEKYNKKPGVIKKRIKLDAEGKMSLFQEEVQLVLEL